MNKSNRNFFIKFIIMVALYLVISNLPIAEGSSLTPLGLTNLAILVACVWGWCTMDGIIVSILGMVVYGLTCGGGIAPAFMGGIGSYIIQMILPLMMICGIMAHTGFTRVLAQKLINSKFATGKPWILLSLMMAVAALLSLVLPGMAVVLVVWDIAYGVFDSCGYEKGEDLPKHMMLGICSAATFGMMCSHISTGVLPMVGILQGINPNLVWKPIPFTLTSIAQLIVFLILNVLLIRFFFKPDVTKLYGYKPPEEKVTFNSDQKIAGVLLVAFILLVSVPAFMPMGPVRGWLESVGLIGFGFLIVAVALILRHKDGSNFITFKEITDSSLSWDFVIMLAAIQTICGNMSAEQYGISDWMVGLFRPLFGGMSPFAAVCFMVVLALVVTNLLDSAITSIVFIVLTMTVAQAVGINEMGLQLTVLKAASYGMLLPGCSPLLTLLYGKIPDGYIDQKTILKSALPQIIVAFVVFAIGGYLTIDMI